MDSGMATHPQRVRNSAFDQGTEGAVGNTAGHPGPGNAASLPAWPRVRASGFGQGIPAPLIEALRACATPGGRIEMGPWTPGSAGQSLADLHLVALGGPDADTNGLDAFADGIGRHLAVCIEGDEALALRAIAAGADGVLYLHDGPDELAKALRAATSGSPALTPSAARALIAHARATPSAPGSGPVPAPVADEAKHANAPVATGGVPSPPSPAIRLTAREREIIRLADQGCTFTQAARVLGVQVSTIYTHVRRLYEKLSVNSLPQALHEARRMGLL